jgi:hypothetical protein
MRIKSISLAIIATLTLSGCSAPLTSSDLSIELNAGEWAYSLTGDEALLEGSIELSNGSNQKLEAVLEVKDGGSDWNELEVKELDEGEPTVSFSVLLEEPGDFEFRLSARLPGSEVIASSAAEVVSVSDLELLVRDLFYQERTLCDDSREACRKFFEDNHYPGIFDFSSSEVISALDRIDWVSSGATPVTDSIIEDQDWKLPVKDCSLNSSENPEPALGRTYLVTLEDRFGSYDAHITFLEGRVYFFYDYGCF